MTTHLQVQGVEFIGIAYNRIQLAAGTTHIVGTGKRLEYVHTVLDSFGLGLDGFAAFNKGQLLDIQRKAVLKTMQNIPGLELFASCILGDSEPGDVKAMGVEAAADENVGARNFQGYVYPGEQQAFKKRRSGITPEARFRPF